MPFSLTPNPAPVVIASTGDAAAEAGKQYDELYPAGTYDAGIENAVSYIIQIAGTSNAANAKAGLEQLAAVCTALAARVIVA
jgi:hypothetical protein